MTSDENVDPYRRGRILKWLLGQVSDYARHGNPVDLPVIRKNIETFEDLKSMDRRNLKSAMAEIEKLYLSLEMINDHNP